MKAAKALAVIGTVFVLLPVLAPIFFTIVSLLVRGQFRFDFLMPAELFPLVLLGGIVLLVSAHMAKQSKKRIGTSLGAAAVLLILSQGIAVVTGLADGRVDPSGWQGYVVLGMIGIFDIAVLGMGIGGIALLKRLFKK